MKGLRNCARVGRRRQRMGRCGWLGTAMLAMPLPVVGQQAPSGVPPETLTLERAVSLALQHNRQVQITGLQVGQAQDRVAQAQTGFLPQLSLLASGGQLLDNISLRFPAGSLGTINGASNPSQPITIRSNDRFAAVYVLTVAEPLTQLPRVRIGVEVQRAGVEIARAREHQQRQTIADNVRRTYYAIQQAQQSVVAINESLRSLQELERIVANGVAQGTALRADLLEVQSRIAQQQIQLVSQLDALQQSHEQMNLLPARPLRTPFTVVATSASSDEPLTDPARIDPDSLRDRALRNRPEIQSAAAQLRQAQLDRRNTEQGYLPDLSLAMNYFGFHTGINPLPDHLWTIGFQLSWTPNSWRRLGPFCKIPCNSPNYTPTPGHPW